MNTTINTLNEVKQTLDEALVKLTVRLNPEMARAALQGFTSGYLKHVRFEGGLSEGQKAELHRLYQTEAI